MEKLTAVGFAQLWKEAEQGNAQAQYMLAGALYNGNGRQRDPIEGAQWLLRAAEQGYTPAQCDLGAMYIKGAGVKQDYYEAMKWLEKAAVQNDALAQHSLGSIWAKGIPDTSVGFFARVLGAGRTRDYIEAYKWFTLAAKNGHSQSLRDRALIAKMWMNDNDIKHGERRAREFENSGKRSGAASLPCPK